MAFKKWKKGREEVRKMLLIEADLTYHLFPCPHCGASAEDEDEPRLKN